MVAAGIDFALWCYLPRGTLDLLDSCSSEPLSVDNGVRLSKIGCRRTALNSAQSETASNRTVTMLDASVRRRDVG